MTVFKRELAIMLTEMLQNYLTQEELLKEIMQGLDANKAVELLESITQNHGLSDEFDQVVAEAEAEEKARHNQ